MKAMYWFRVFGFSWHPSTTPNRNAVSLPDVRTAFAKPRDGCGAEPLGARIAMPVEDLTTIQGKRSAGDDAA